MVKCGPPVDLPPSHPGWKTFPEAIANFKAWGFSECVFAPEFSSEQLVEAIQKLVEQRELKVVDATDLVPEGPNASWLTWPCQNCQLQTRSEAEPEKVFVVLRTKANTPAFLGGTLYGYACSHGSLERAAQYVKATNVPCPAGIIMHGGGQHFSLPATVSQCGPELVATIVASVVLDKPEMFSCALCADSFVKMVPDGDDCIISMSKFMGNTCGHCFHAHCLTEHFRSGRVACPACGEVLPPTWNLSACLPPRPLTGTAEEQAAQLNDLAEQVRQTMIRDGLIAEGDMESFV